ncbi:MAG: cation diffusion facilitator family transporter [Verrucomicrobiota bacterium]
MNDHPPSDDGHEGHDHAGHSHAASVTAGNERRIRNVFFLTFGYAIVQAAGGWWSGSLALIADSGHMVSDAAALLLALIAYRVAARSPDAERTYGFHRVRVLAALANGASLLVLVAWISWEAAGRLFKPTEVMAGPMLAIAAVGMIINITGVLILNAGNKKDSNLQGAFLHVMGDLLGSVAAITAAIGILYTGWSLLDPILSVLVSLLVVRSAWRLVSESIRVLLQAVPRGLDARAAEAEVAKLPGVAEAGHFHAWTLTDQSVVATIHVTAKEGTDPISLPPLVAGHLGKLFSIDHVTVQVDPAGGLKNEHSSAGGS